MTVSLSPLLAQLAEPPKINRSDTVSGASNGSPSSTKAGTGFTGILESASAASDARTVTPPIRPLVAHEARKTPPLEKFEAFVLRSFVEDMLPSSDSEFFGKGMAGNVWRSMLAEQIGDQLAKNGGIGIAASIAGRPGEGFAGQTAASQKRSSSVTPLDLVSAGATHPASRKER